jgi:fluoroacetyl-CoA thioesterase
MLPYIAHSIESLELGMNLKARTAEATLRMYSGATAEAAGLYTDDGGPAVLATSRMIELMELAASRLIKSRLKDGETSVGVALNVTYAAQTAASGTVRAVASYVGVTGRLHRFAIHVFDESGLIGSAEHTRAVVTERRLSAVARRLAGMPAAQTNIV